VFTFVLVGFGCGAIQDFANFTIPRAIAIRHAFDELYAAALVPHFGVNDVRRPQRENRHSLIVGVPRDEETIAANVRAIGPLTSRRSPDRRMTLTAMSSALTFFRVLPFRSPRPDIWLFVVFR
jgi:hypothetical protein